MTGGAGFGRSNGAAAINDMRFGTGAGRHTSHYRVEPMDSVAGTVTGASHVANGRICISDTRLKDRDSRHAATYQVVKWEEVGPCVTGTRFGSGAPAITDPRINCTPRSGTYGVVGMYQTMPTVIGSGDVHNGAASIADDRLGTADSQDVEYTFTVPGDKERGMWIIQSPHDGAWHRPLTTFELAMLQGFPKRMPDGRPFQLVGKNDARWRERIGNAVPPAAARAIAESMLLTLMASQTDDWFGLSLEPVWVAPGEREVKEPSLVH